MQAGFLVLLITLVVAALCARTVVAAPAYQHLEPRAGHVPVYIREGDTPLSEIHPSLPEAFGEDDAQQIENSTTSNTILSSTEAETEGVPDETATQS